MKKKKKKNNLKISEEDKSIDVAITKPSGWDNMRPKQRLQFLNKTWMDFKAKGIRHKKLEEVYLKMLNQMDQDIEMGNADKWR